MCATWAWRTTLLGVYTVITKMSLRRGWAPPEAHFTLQPTLKASDQLSRRVTRRPTHRFLPLFTTTQLKRGGIRG